MRLPQTDQDFEAQFATELDCIAFLRARRWKDGFQCPRCGGRAAWELKTRPLDQCKQCNHQVSLTAGTVFHGTRKPLRLWFRVIARFLVSKGGCSALEISRVFGLNYETAWSWLHKLRSTMDRTSGKRLRGILEADGAPLDGSQDAPAVFTAIEYADYSCGRVRIGVAGALTAAAACAFLRRVVTPEARVRMNGFPQLCIPFQVDPDSVAGVPPKNRENPRRRFRRAHRVLSNFGLLLESTYAGGVQRKHLQAYADEFVFRFNRRNSWSRFLLFFRLIDGAQRRPPTKRALFQRPHALVAT